MADMMDEIDPPGLPENNTVPASINMEFNSEEDNEILGTTPDFCYWWNCTESEINPPRVTGSIIRAHFRLYWDIVRGRFIMLLKSNSFERPFPTC